MKLRPLASNMTELTLNDGTTVLFSYQTPVAAHVPGSGFYRTTGHYSKTTTRHINKWLAGAAAMPVSPERLEAAITTEKGVQIVDERRRGTSTPREENPPRGPGKFSDSIEELLYAVDHDQTVGSTDEPGWYGMVSGLLKPEAKEQARDLEMEWDEKDAAMYDWPLNAIIHEDSDGFVSVTSYGPPHANRDMMRDWREIEAEYEQYYHGGEDW